jgi:hypothetical protein
MMVIDSGWPNPSPDARRGHEPAEHERVVRERHTDECGGGGRGGERDQAQPADEPNDRPDADARQDRPPRPHREQYADDSRSDAALFAERACTQ